MCVAPVYSTLLIDAIEEGNTNKAKRLINKGANTEATEEQDQNGWTPLHYATSSATSNENTKIIAALIAAGATE